MTKILRRFWLFYLILTFSYAAEAQKVKYKDIFGLLSTRQYEQAEPFMKRYLAANDDNPNAFLYMGVILQEKAAKMDVLTQTQPILVFTDSAIYFFNKANQTIDEKEIRKNKEYYQAYNRRDVRTGEFGVKLSDIQLDIETRIKTLKERADALRMTKHYYSLADTLYKKSVAMFASLTKGYSTERQLYLRADEATLMKLSTLSITFDSCMKAFGNYKTSSSHLGRTGYDQTVSLVDITDFGKDGIAGSDFLQNELRLWDYRKFAEKSKQIIEKEIIPMRQHLLSYDGEINKLRQKLLTDSLSVRSDLTKLVDVLLYEQLKRFDDVPLPMEIFGMKTTELEYRSALLEHAAVSDSSDLHFQLSLLNDELGHLKKLDSITTKLLRGSIDQRVLDYEPFVTKAFGSTPMLTNTINAYQRFCLEEKEKKENEVVLRKNALNWILEGLDSIPLNMEVTSMRFKPLFVQDEKYTVGLNFKDSVTAEGYFYAITPSRRPSLKFTFPVEKGVFKTSTFPLTKSLTYADPSGQVYYVLVVNGQPLKERYNATLAKIYSSDGVAWTNNLALPFTPSEISFKAETSELSISDSVNTMIVDKNGKVVR